MADYTDNDNDSGWLPDEELQNLIMERTIVPNESDESMTKRLMAEKAPLAAKSIIRLAIHSKNERTRLDASKYIIDRVLGKIGDEKLADEESPITKLINSITGAAMAGVNDIGDMGING